LVLWAVKGRAAFKDRIALRVGIVAENLPYRESFLAYLREEKAKGRYLVLATAAHSSIAQAVATHLGIFDKVLATESGHNLKGEAKLQAIREHVGASFVYAGDSKADLPVWFAAEKSVLVGAAPHIVALVQNSVPVERCFPKESTGLADWFQALRVHQWLKNVLLFVPLLTAFSFMEAEKLGSIMLAFLSFSFAASATYLVNDLLDIESDRAHPRKCCRPFASARVSIVHGIFVAGAAFFLAFAVAIMVSTGFCMMLLLYLVLTSAYSWKLKEYVLIDVLMLSFLYTLRILAGSVAAGITTSSWLLAFSVFLFLSLALVKRCAELMLLKQNNITATQGRDYRVSDLVVLWPLGVGAALASVVVFGLFINAAETQARYTEPYLLWLVAIGLIYWLGRLWIKTSRGEMDDDPMVYAVRDYGSRVTVLGMIIVTLIAHFVALDDFL
jgi:4-hydroxybenzoate polyprenyltransferase